MSSVQTTRMSKKDELKRIDWKIVKKIITLLYYSGEMKKTNIAMNCNLGYDKCIRYINWLLILDLIKNEMQEDGFKRISLTKRGAELYRMEFVVE